METISKDASVTSRRSDPARTLPRMALGFSLLAAFVIALSDALTLSRAATAPWLVWCLAAKDTCLGLLAGVALLRLSRRSRLEQAQMRQELYRAQHDPSTKLLSRYEWTRRVDMTLAETRIPLEPAVVVSVSVDRYDYLVHRFGSSNMHQWLGVFGRYLRMLARGDDHVGCVSSSVFIIYVHGRDCRTQAMEMVARMLESGKRTFMVQGEPVTLNLNIGLCAYPDDGGNAEDLLARANIAMRRSTADGPDRSCWYKPEIAEKVISRVNLERDLEKALERGELALNFQPRVCLLTGTTCGAEALLRWRHPQRGLVPPAAFIGVAEDSGLIIDIGKWVLAESLAFLRKWMGAGLPAITVSVNVSNAQLNKGDFLKDLTEALGFNRAYASLLELELTESLAMSDPQLTMQVLRQVKQAGMRVALDDFGTGYSSLSYLQRFPIDCLKIDRSFIADLLENRNSQELIKTVIALGHSLNARVLAEGIENRQQVRVLGVFGCDEGQGFHYGMPMDGDELIAEASHAHVDSSGQPRTSPGSRIMLPITREAADARN
ncbi:MAG TPA: GGDEF domain-containing phosphodiesterase [Gammaproteobacteria bacterium]|nr:GGDEF domain-containing phosphodiesterase [Gammaproteobacteria bacterium]